MASESRLLTPAEAAAAFGVCRETVRRWAGEGRLKFILTPGGHRRYCADEVAALITSR